MVYSKAIAAAVTVLAAVLITFNIDMSEELKGALITIATALAVVLAPKNADPV